MYGFKHRRLHSLHGSAHYQSTTVSTQLQAAITSTVYDSIYILTLRRHWTCNQHTYTPHHKKLL